MNNNIKKILIIEDSETSALLLQSMFDLRTDYEISVARTAKKAVSLLKKINFDLILLDIMMPHIDGFSILKQIKHNVNLKNIPIIMISALNSDANIKKSFELGAIEFISKPVNEDLLLNKVDTILK